MQSGSVHPLSVGAQILTFSSHQINYISNPSTPPDLDDSDLQLTLESEINPAVLAVKYLAAGASITCTLLHVKYGTFHGEAAGLVAFHSEFFFPVVDSRTKAVTIKVRFTQTNPSLPTKLPRVLHHSPRQLQSAMTTALSIHETSHADLTLQPPAPADIGSIGVGRSNERTFTRVCNTIIRSSVLTHDNSRIGRQCLNTVVWAMEENEAQKSGVPLVFRGAIIVQLPLNSEGGNPTSQFRAQIEIKAKQACEARQLFASVRRTWGAKDDIICFDSKVDFRADGLSDRLEEIDLNELLRLPAVDILPPGY
jgi:hypothetical protein